MKDAVGRGPGRAVAVAVVAVVALAATWTAAATGVAGWEPPAGRWAYDLPDGLTPALEAVQQAGGRAAPFVTTAVLVAAGWRWRAGGVLVAGLLTWGAAHLLKEVVDRPRPDLASLERAPRDVLTNAGFPSTHAAIAAALATAVILLGRHPRWRTGLLVAVPVLTALARVHLAVHWPLDVIGGAALGTLAAVGVAALVEE